MGVVFRIAAALVAPLLLIGCVLTPGKFVSSLRIDADGRFAFAYQGEVIAVDPSESMSGGMTSSDEGEDSEPDPDAAREAAKKKAELETKRKAIAEALSKEHGYKSVRYVGDGIYMIDYAVEGVLTHHFVYPFNADAEVVLPFIAVERRANGTIRVRAPGYANEASSDSRPSLGDAASKLDGVFTLDTDAEIVSQNSEDGATDVGGRKVLTWRATPLTKDAPLAVLRVTQ